jgi:hypothetical protein
MNTNKEILIVVQGELEGKTIMFKALGTPMSGEMQWHEKTVGTGWDFEDRVYKVKPMSIRDYIESELGATQHPLSDPEYWEGARHAYYKVLSKLKEMENK